MMLYTLVKHTIAMDAALITLLNHVPQKSMKLPVPWHCTAFFRLGQRGLRLPRRETKSFQHSFPGLRNSRFIYTKAQV